MRLINMRDLAHVRRNQLGGHQVIGKGSFATVFQAHPNSSTVSKLTTDCMGYALLADGYWLQTREPVEQHFPMLVADHGWVGTSKGLAAYLVEVERLRPVSKLENKRTVTRIIKEYYEFALTRNFRTSAVRRWNLNSMDFLSAKLDEGTDPQLDVFAALQDFIGSFGGALDLKRNNFMERADGTLVWNDVVYDIESFDRETTRRYRHMH